jgi:membrane-bound serine protease (ClpP class)
MFAAVTTLFVSLFLVGASDSATVRLLTVDGPISPAMAGYLLSGLKTGGQEGDRLILIEIDTPGGLDSSMREIIKGILASTVPVVVYVAPAGGRAASAGALITLAADLSAMAPGTTIGAAHPVSIGRDLDKIMGEKVLNDAAAYAEGLAKQRGRNTDLARRMVTKSLSMPAERALADHMVDLIAADRQELLHRLNGRTILHGGKQVTLQLSGARVVSQEMGQRQRILAALSNPNIAYILLMLGILGIFFEIANPGAILPGVVGAICLILAFFALQTLPVNYAGLLLLLLALIFFIAEIKIISHGMLTVAGVLSLILGSIMLFESPEPYLRVSWNVIAVTVISITSFVVVAIVLSIRAYRKKPTTGMEGLLGEEGVSDSDIGGQGRVLVHGEYWQASSDEPIAAGEPVIIVAVEGMRLKVKRG